MTVAYYFKDLPQVEFNADRRIAVLTDWNTEKIASIPLEQCSVQPVCTGLFVQQRCAVYTYDI